MKFLFALVFLLFSSFSSNVVHATEDCNSSAPLIRIVAAENFYGSIAQQIGGNRVIVVSTISNPNQDPHEFQPTADTAKEIADADIVIKNGAGYDAWIDKLIATKGKPNRVVINVSNFVKTESPTRMNPHFWYNPETMVLLADQLAVLLKVPSAGVAFRKEMKPLFEKMELLKTKYPNLTVTATEPLFTPMATILKWKMLHENYQWAIMNDTEPSFQEIAEYQESLNNKKVKLLFYNSQVVNPSTLQLQKLAKKNQIPIIGITELQPLSAANYQAWMLAQLSRVEEALRK